MDERSGIQRFRDYLSGKANLDMELFRQDVEEDLALRRTLQGLEGLGDHAPAPDKEKIWMAVRGVVRKRNRVRLWWRYGVAASIVVPLCVFLLFFASHREGGRNEISVAKVHESKQVQLVLAEGDVVDLTGMQGDTLIRDRGVGIQVAQGKGLTYREEMREGDIPAYNVLRVPRGNEYYIKLSDGTEVWMNSDSELRFPVRFGGNERKLYLKGEAYFKVTRDSLRPFRVMADEMSVEVLGTSFNVNAYRDEGALLATLVEGRVRVKDTASGYECVLCPNQQAELQQGLGVVREVQVDGVVAWKEGRFLFREMPLEKIAKQLERWLDVEFVFLDDALREHTLTGIVKRYNSVEDICALIAETANVEFKIHGNKVMVSYKK